LGAEVSQDEVHAGIKQDIRYGVPWAGASGGLAWFCQALDREVRVVQKVLKDVLHMSRQAVNCFVVFGGIEEPIDFCGCEAKMEHRSHECIVMRLDTGKGFPQYHVKCRFQIKE
jgi:hypothetical protein